MKRIICMLLLAVLLAGCGEQAKQPYMETTAVEELDGPQELIKGADVSSLISLENSGVQYYDFQGQPSDLIQILAQAGMNYLRVRVWHDPYDAQGKGYGGGNCDLSNAIAIGQRGAEHGMKLLVDLHYSDFWADPGKQQPPKAWEGMSFEEKKRAVCDYTLQTITALKEAGVPVAMVQIGNETTGGFCGEWTAQGQYTLMAAAAQTLRQLDDTILIAVHYTNPEKGGYADFADYLQRYGVDYDVFATSYYPYWHGTVENLKDQLRSVTQGYGKKIMVAETSWAYTTEDTDDHQNSVGQQEAANGAYPFTVQGQTQELIAVMEAVESFGELGLGVFYWEPGWIAVPGANWQQRSVLWETHGSGWASSYAGEYDPWDAGKYYGGSACDNQALFDKNGYPLESLKAFS